MARKLERPYQSMLVQYYSSGRCECLSVHTYLPFTLPGQELKAKKLWLSVDGATDRQTYSVVNVMVPTMEEDVRVFAVCEFPFKQN